MGGVSYPLQIGLTLVVFGNCPERRQTLYSQLISEVLLFLVIYNMVGLSLVAPACHCMPKYFSNGSWYNSIVQETKNLWYPETMSNSSTKCGTMCMCIIKGREIHTVYLIV